MLKNSSPFKQDLIIGFRFKKYLTPVVLLGIILLLGTALRFYDLGAESYWMDEMFSVVEGQQSIHQLITSGKLDQPPAYYLPFHLWLKIFGTNEVSTRTFSALVGICAIFVIYLIGRELFGKEVGVLSAFLMAISKFQIYYSQMTGFYIFFELMTLLSILFFILALKSKKISYFFLYGVASTLMLYSHSFGVFILATQNLFFLLQGKKDKELIVTWIISQILILFTFVPYVFPLISGGSGIKDSVLSNTWGLPIPSVMNLMHSIYYFIFNARGERSWGVVLANYSAAVALFVSGTWIYAIRKGKSNWVSAVRGWFASLKGVPDVAGKLLLVSCWLVCPVIMPFIFSLLFIPIYSDRYVISAAPSLYLLIALGIYNARKVVPLIISLGALVIMIAPGLSDYYAQDVNEQWKEAAEYVEENSKSDEILVFAPNDLGIQQKTFNWYYHGTLPGCGISRPLPDSAIWDDLKQCIRGYERFWVIIRGSNNAVPPNRYRSFFLNPNQEDFSLIQEHHFVKVSVFLLELTKR